MSEWLINAGIVGFVNVLNFNGDKVNIFNQYIEFDSSVLDGFEEKYFNYFSDKQLMFTIWNNVVKFQEKIDLIKNNKSYTDRDITSINNQIEFIEKKFVKDDYIKAYSNTENEEDDLLKKSKSLTKIKLKKNETVEDIKTDIDEQILIIEDIIKFIKRDDVKKNLVVKDLCNNVLDKFWNKISFLNSSNKEIDNVYKEFNKYFIQSVQNYINSDKTKAKYTCYICDSKISTCKKGDAFNLSWLKSIGVDGSRKASHFWNLNRDDLICPICNLIYSCAPLGFKFIKGNGLFINNNSSVYTLLESNKYSLKSNTSISELEYKSYTKIADSFTKYKLERIENEINNIQIIKLDVNNSFRAYTFNILSKDMIAFLCENSKMLKFLLGKQILWHTDSSDNKHYVYLYKETIDRIYRNQNLFSLIDFSLNKITRGEYYGLDETQMLLSLNSNFLKKGDSMNNKKIYKIRCLGNELKRGYSIRGISNKIDGLSYKLLNAIKVKDSNKFLDALINAYAYLGLEIPAIFLDCLDDDFTFQTIGYAFILGLMGENNKINKGDNIDEE